MFVIFVRYRPGEYHIATSYATLAEAKEYISSMRPSVDFERKLAKQHGRAPQGPEYVISELRDVKL